MADFNSIHTGAKIDSVISAIPAMQAESTAKWVILNDAVNRVSALEDAIDGGGDSRPDDWLTIPDVSDNEIYLLFHLSPPTENYIAFTVICTGSYTVEYGTIIGGMFVPSGSTSLSSGSNYEGKFMYNDWGDEVSTGLRQIMFRITGVNITSFAPNINEERNYQYYVNWSVVEFKGKLPSCTSCVVGSSATSRAWSKLKYFSLIGTNSITSFQSMFQGCSSLVSVSELDTSKGTSFLYMFQACSSLTTIPALNTSNGTNFQQMFYGCSSLETIPYIDTSKGTSFQAMFYNCYALRSVPQLDTSSATNFSQVFYSCSSLITVPQINTGKATILSNLFASCYSLKKAPILDISSVNTVINMFSGCYSLTGVEFSGTNTAWPAALSFQYSSLTASAAETFFQSLPTITTSRVITLTDTPAAITLLDEQVAIATQKNWTVTL